MFNLVKVLNLDKVLFLNVIADTTSFGLFYLAAGSELSGLRLILEEIVLHGAKIRKTAGWFVVFNLVKVLNLDKVLFLNVFADTTSFGLFHLEAGSELGGLRLILKEIVLHGAKIRKSVVWR